MSKHGYVSMWWMYLSMYNKYHIYLYKYNFQLKVSHTCYYSDVLQFSFSFIILLWKDGNASQEWGRKGRSRKNYAYNRVCILSRLFVFVHNKRYILSRQKILDQIDAVVSKNWALFQFYSWTKKFDEGTLKIQNVYQSNTATLTQTLQLYEIRKHIQHFTFIINRFNPRAY